jgi:hypothetical protein
MMKRKVLFVFLALGIAGLAAAQGWGRGMWGWPGAAVAAEAATVSGNLTIAQGSPAVKSGDTTYLIPGLFRYVGFIDGLKDGARVSLEGEAFTTTQDPKVKILRANKLTIGAKDYDLARPPVSVPAPSVMPRRPFGRW